MSCVGFTGVVADCSARAAAPLAAGEPYGELGRTLAGLKGSGGATATGGGSGVGSEAGAACC